LTRLEGAEDGAAKAPAKRATKERVEKKRIADR